MIISMNPEEIKKITKIIIEHFKENESKINNLNVFPVPDGDTGTNMLLTLKSIEKEVSKLESFGIKEFSDAVAFGGLMGARGNSGVILSQILKGFFDILSGDSVFNMTILEDAAQSAKNLAYSSVQNPTEGTMLTIIKDIYQHLKTFNEKNDSNVMLSSLMDSVISETEKSLVRTTFLLPVLKEANVVDAGAQGILEILKGLRKSLIELNKINGNLNGPDKTSTRLKTNENLVKPEKNISEEENIPDKTHEKELSELSVSGDIKYIYCTEFILTGKRINLSRLREDIESLGDSAMVVGNENLVKIHVHSNSPQRVLARALREGALHEIDINNMVDQYNEKMKTSPKIKPETQTIGLISISNGEGIEEIFKSVGVDIIIKGGQTMNPSTYEIVKAIKKLDTSKIIIFPNNKNIILTATQAAKISKKDVIVIPTKTILQGINAVLNFNKDLSIGDNLKNMEDAYTRIKSGEVTIAVRDANLLVGDIKKGDFIGLYDGKIKVIADNAVSAVLELIKDMYEGKDSIATFYYGKNALETDSQIIRDEISKSYPGLDIEFYNGGQPFYHYIFSIE